MQQALEELENLPNIDIVDNLLFNQASYVNIAVVLRVHGGK